VGSNKELLHEWLIQFVQRNWKSPVAKRKPHVYKKSRGRPAGRKYSEVVPVRLTADTIKAVDRRFKGMTRSEAIRTLVDLALSDRVSAPMGPFTEKLPELAHLLPSLCPEPPLVEVQLAQTVRLQGDEWHRAWLAWMGGDREAFAVLIGSGLIIPSELRTQLKQLFGPPTRYADKLVLKRSKATGPIRRWAQKVDMGMRVLKLVDDGVELKKAKGEVEKKYGKSASYIDHCMKLARTHYRRLCEGIAQSDPEVGSRGRIWPKLTAEARKLRESATRKPTIVRINNVDVPVEFY
jgi:hypothetical protein